MRDALDEVLDAHDQRQQRNHQDARWPAWAQLVLAVGAVVVTIVLAYSALDKRISLVEQKIDYIANRVGRP